VSFFGDDIHQCILRNGRINDVFQNKHLKMTRYLIKECQRIQTYVCFRLVGY
jgi:hypothetical protein